MKKLILLIFVIFSINLYSFETDQVSSIGKLKYNFHYLINNKTNMFIEQMISQLNKLHERPTRLQLIKLIKDNFGSMQFSYWLKNHYSDKMWHDQKNVFKNIDISNSPTIFASGITSTILFGTVPIGLDKLSHFFSVGFEYFVNYYGLNSNGDSHYLFDINAVIKDFGDFPESSYLGGSTSKIYSAADMVANFRGFEFYKKMYAETEEGYLGVDKNNKLFLKKFIDLGKFVDIWWNEAFNPNIFNNKGLQNKVLKEIQLSCSSFPHIENYRTSLYKMLEIYAQVGINSKYVLKTLPMNIYNICKSYQKNPTNEKITPVNIMKKKKIDNFWRKIISKSAKAITYCENKKQQSITIYNKLLEAREKLHLTLRLAPQDENLSCHKVPLNIQQILQTDRSSAYIEICQKDNFYQENYFVEFKTDSFLNRTFNYIKRISLGNDLPLLAGLPYLFNHQRVSVSSLNNYYDFADKKGFLFRLNPTFCKFVNNFKF